jgi:hypothetical protein
MILLEHLNSNNSIDIYELFWSDLSDKIKYFLNFYQFVKSDFDQSIQYIENFLQSIKSVNMDSSSAQVEREIFRLTAINGFFVSNPQLFQPFIQTENKNISLQKKLKATPLISIPLYSLTFTKIIKETIEKLMGLDFARFLREEKNFQQNPTNTQENLEKDIGTSVLSRSILGDESILGSMINIDFNVNNSHQKDNSKCFFN